MSETQLSREQGIADGFRKLHFQLQIAYAGIVVAVAALHHQNADRDEEIARVLEHCVGNRLSNEIERTAELIATLRAFPAYAYDLDSS
jgi:hypothetical protein